MAVGIQVLSLCSCGRAGMLSADAKMNYKYIKNVMELVTDKKTEKLYELYSQNVKNEDEELLSQIEEFVDFVDGDLVDCDNLYGEESEGKNHYTAEYVCKVTTTEGEYYVRWKRKAEYKDSDINGLITLGIQSASDYDKDSYLPSSLPGAYVVYEGKHDELKARVDDYLGVNDIVVEIAEETFPDEIFRKYVIENFDTDQPDGKLSVYEVQRSKDVLMDGEEGEPSMVASLKGIEYLSNVQFIRINYSLVEDLDVSNNPELEVLAIEHTNIDNIDLSNNEKMRILECSPSVKVTGYNGSISTLESNCND